MSHDPILDAILEHIQPQHRQRLAYICNHPLLTAERGRDPSGRPYSTVLQQRALLLGWPPDRIVVGPLWDEDTATHDSAPTQLTTTVATGTVGLILGLSLRRLERTHAWPAFVHACAQTETLLLQGDAPYDLINLSYQQELLATMELVTPTWLQGRCVLGHLYKAQRTTLRLPLPIGFCYNEPPQVVFDPDPRVQATLRQIFQTFDHVRSLRATVRVLQEQSVAFPRRAHNGPGRASGWRTIHYADVWRTLHNPRYAGAYVYGRTRRTHPLQGKA